MTNTHVEDPDTGLIREVAEGEENAFGQLVRKYEHSVMNTIYRYLGSYSEAEDVAQEVFIKVWRNASKFKAKSKFSTWLYRIVVNQCLNYRSKHSKKCGALDEKIKMATTLESSEVEIEFERRERIEMVRKAVDELPKTQRIAIILSKYEGKSYKEIAQIMEVSLSSVTSLIFRAKDNLRKRLLPLRLNGHI
jgi:RNA polymerase sigma-70 factor (ECF subfamily)